MSDDAADLYRALLVSDRLPTLRRLTYRCHAHRCLLLDAVDTPLGVIVHEGARKFSPMVNHRRSNPGMRASRTVDGFRHWKSNTYFLLGSALGYSPAALPGVPAPPTDVSCDHVLAHKLDPQDFAADWAAGHAEVRVRADGSRYAVH